MPATYKITKAFEACYGHRVHNQTLIQGYSQDQCLVCRHLHGHQARIEVSLEAPVLERGMVTDFKNLGWFKKFVDNFIDHKFIMDINDPLLPYEVPLIIESPLSIPYKVDYSFLETQEDWGWYDPRDPWAEGLQFKTIKPEKYSDLPIPLREKYEGMIFVDFVPTSENLSKWLFDIVDYKMSKIGVTTKSVKFYETPKSSSLYEVETGE